MRFVIAGVAGFIGSHLADRLLSDGHHVIGFDNLSSGDMANVRWLMKRPLFQFVNLDVATPTPAPVLAGIRGVAGVLHLASPASPVDYYVRPYDALKAGSYATHNLLALARANHCRFLLASTSEVYGDPLAHPQGENYYGNVNPIGPRAVYDEAKRYAEAVTSQYGRDGLDIRIARIFNTYGPRMRPNDGRAISEFINAILSNKPLTVYGDGTQTRSFCYVDDLVDGLVKLFFAASNAETRQPINLGNPMEISINALADVITAKMHATPECESKPARENDPLVRCPNIEKAYRLLGWRPRVTLGEGLDKTIAWFVEPR